MKDIKQIIAENIIQLRKKNKLTQAELAEKLNYTDKAISKWERAESVPDIEILKKMSEMFGVTVDFLLTENAQIDQFKLPRQGFTNRLAVALLAVCVVFLAATMIFVYAQINLEINLWTVFVWAVPASAVVLLIFNYLWGRKYEIYINSVFAWGLLTAIYLQFLSLNMWLIFIIGIPVQAVIVLWSKIKLRK